MFIYFQVFYQKQLKDHNNKGTYFVQFSFDGKHLISLTQKPVNLSSPEKRKLNKLESKVASKTPKMDQSPGQFGPNTREVINKAAVQCSPGGNELKKEVKKALSFSGILYTGERL